jgi:hypothetical protein
MSSDFLLWELEFESPIYDMLVLELGDPFDFTIDSGTEAGENTEHA